MVDTLHIDIAAKRQSHNDPAFNLCLIDIQL